MFSNIIDLLSQYVVKKIFFLFLIFWPLEFFENLTFKRVPPIGFWIKNYFYFFIFFTPWGTTKKLPFLKNRPTLIYIVRKRRRKKYILITKTFKYSHKYFKKIVLILGENVYFVVSHRNCQNYFLLVLVDCDGIFFQSSSGCSN